MAVRLRVLGRGIRDEIGLEGLLQFIVGYVVLVELLDYGRVEVLAEPGEVSRVRRRVSVTYLMVNGWLRNQTEALWRFERLKVR